MNIYTTYHNQGEVNYQPLQTFLQSLVLGVDISLCIDPKGQVLMILY